MVYLLAITLNETVSLYMNNSVPRQQNNSKAKSSLLNIGALL